MNPKVQRLSSGFWHVRWSQNLWVQWPTHREPIMSDGFGWIEQHHLNEATEAVKEYLNR